MMVLREVYLAGQIALVPETMDMLLPATQEGALGWVAELRLAMRNIAAVLRCSNSDAALVGECRVFVTAQLVAAAATTAVAHPHLCDTDSGRGHGGGDYNSSNSRTEAQAVAPPYGFARAIQEEVKACLVRSRLMCFPSSDGGDTWGGLVCVLVVEALPRDAVVEVEAVATDAVHQPGAEMMVRDAAYAVEGSQEASDAAAVAVADGV